MLTLRVIATRVIALTTEPLLTARQALLIEGCLDDAVRARPVWMGAWISGLLAGTLSTLPPDDPWRHIHARYKGRDFGDLSVDLTAPVTSECAISPRGRFASPEDHLDLIVPEYPPDRLADLALAGAPEQLPEGSATLLAGAVDGWRAAFAAWLTVAQSLSGTLTPSDDLEPDLHPSRRRPHSPVTEASLAALRDVAHRRRAYLGSLDPDWVLFAATGMGPCDEVEHSFQPTWLRPDESVEQILAMLAPISAFDRWSWPEDALIPPDAYEDFRVGR